jgi:hypothetical protein
MDGFTDHILLSCISIHAFCQAAKTGKDKRRKKSLPRTHSEDKSSCKVVSLAAALVALLLGKHIWQIPRKDNFPA